MSACWRSGRRAALLNAWAWARLLTLDADMRAVAEPPMDGRKPPGRDSAGSRFPTFDLFSAAPARRAFAPAALSRKVQPFSNESMFSGMCSLWPDMLAECACVPCGSVEPVPVQCFTPAADQRPRRQSRASAGVYHCSHPAAADRRWPLEPRRQTGGAGRQAARAVGATRGRGGFVVVVILEVFYRFLPRRGKNENGNSVGRASGL